MNLTTDLAQRLAHTRDLLTQWEIDALLLSQPDNRRWLSGFTGSTGWLLVTTDDAYIVADFRYWEQARRQAPHFTLHQMVRSDDGFKDMFALAPGPKIGIESDYVTLDNMEQYRRVAPNIDWHPISNPLQTVRQQKSPYEIETIRAAAAITDAVMAQIPQLVTLGMTERQLAWQLERAMREEGADALAFDVIVASGPNAALAHHQPTDRQLQAGDTLIIDMGAMLNGYASDMTRSFFLGPPSDKFTHIYNIVKLAHDEAIKGLTPNLSCRDADALARDVIDDAGFADQFGHGLGHNLGTNVHELPYLSHTAPENQHLTANMVVTIEPGIYIPDWGGIRIEDLILINADGSTTSLSQCPHTPHIPLS
ncbi:MAG TPA: aminopeptidase P family protein [Anaerolineae bacterium]|nr:aminopeptidase P family protein [Anaerolineae bacterium]